jgi:hypothetical protein
VRRIRSQRERGWFTDPTQEGGGAPGAGPGWWP